MLTYAAICGAIGGSDAECARGHLPGYQGPGSSQRAGATSPSRDQDLGNRSHHGRSQATGRGRNVPPVGQEPRSESPRIRGSRQCVRCFAGPLSPHGFRAGATRENRGGTARPGQTGDR